MVRQKHIYYTLDFGSCSLSLTCAAKGSQAAASGCISLRMCSSDGCQFNFRHIEKLSRQTEMSSFEEPNGRQADLKPPQKTYKKDAKKAMMNLCPAVLTCYNK